MKRVIMMLAALASVAVAGETRDRTRDRGSVENSRSRDDWSDETRGSSDWSSDWTGGGNQSVPEPAGAAGLVAGAGVLVVLRRRRKGGAA